MKHRSFVIVLVLLIALSLGAASVMAAGQAPQQPAVVAAAMGTGFTYQGRLVDGGIPANGNYDFEFKLYDALTSGTQLGGTVDQTIAITDGYFTTQLDFGQVFNGDARYLEIGVRPGGTSSAYTVLFPRQALTPVPYALALPGLWTQQNAASPNLIGGYSGNVVRAAAVGATISGGGATGSINGVVDSYGTVGGGSSNTAGNDDGDPTSAAYATVGGGSGNLANKSYATVGGGESNVAGGNSATVGGRHR